MTVKDQITLIIEGLPEDDGRVRLSVFMSGLQSLNATITKLDREANDGHQATIFRIAELSYSSPIRVVLEPQPLPKRPYVASEILDSLDRLTQALSNGDDLSGLDADLLEDVRGLARPVGRSVKSAALVFRDKTFELTRSVADNIDRALAVDEECEGSIEGMLEQINVHLAANVFHIYPDVGPKKVACRFPSKLMDDAIAAVGKRVEISGTLRFRVGARYPHQVAVAQIEPFPPDDEIPDWDDLRGRAPNCTGELSTEAFVRELRDGWR